ncbi:unnamed protein product [Caenorhabditis nigoni]
MVKFMRLPNLVKHLIFEEMKLNEILLLSFCSKQVQKSIKQQYRLEPNKGFRITCSNKDHRTYYHFQDGDEKGLELIVDHKENDKELIYWKYVDKFDLLKKYKFLNGVFIKLKSGFIFEKNGLRFECSICFDQKSGIPTLYFEKDMMKKWPMELHKYCVDLFRTTTDLEMIMNLDDSSDLHESQTIKNLYLHDSCESLDPEIADEFFEKANIQNSFSTLSQKLDWTISDDSKLWNIPNLCIYSYDWVFARQLTQFTGKNAYLVVKDHNDIAQSMNEFLKHWLNSDNTKLETMIVVTYCESTEKLFDGIKTSKWDPERRQARYVPNAPFERIFENQNRTSYTFVNTFHSVYDYLDCTNAFDIVRESDGLLASVKVHDGVFFMFVWHTRFS